MLLNYASKQEDKMSFYDDPENVRKYVEMCEGYDGSNLHSALAKALPAKSSLLELGSGAGFDIEYLRTNYLVTGSDLSVIGSACC